MKLPRGKNSDPIGANTDESTAEGPSGKQATEAKLGRLGVRQVESTIVNGVVAVIVLIGATSLAIVASKKELAESIMNTSPTTAVTNIDNSILIDPNQVGHATIDPITHGSSSIVDCSIVPAAHAANAYINTNDYASAYNPVVTPLVQIGADNISNYATVHEVDWLGSEATLGLADSLDISISKTDRVTLSSASDGRWPSPFVYGENSPNGSFNLTPGNVASGAFGLMDYTIENYKGNFYLGLVCDPWKTQQILAHPNG